MLSSCPDDLVATIPQMSYQRPAQVMIEMLKRRHLAPIYGGRVPIAPETRDYFVIDKTAYPALRTCAHGKTRAIQRRHRDKCRNMAVPDRVSETGKS